jgi:tetratricopeptide (TPR) repeat protein
VITGYKIKELPEGVITPLSLGRYKILSDPRSIFGRGESLEGLILTAEKPEVRLFPWEAGAPPIEVTDVTRDGDVVLFRRPLAGIGPGNYDLVVQVNGVEVCRRRVSVLSFAVEKPLEFERTESLAARDSLLFELGQEHLNTGRPDLALGIFEALPEGLWRPANLPVIARAYYLRGDYARAAELLERPGVERNYAVLLVLGNASLELRRLDRAAEYFELLRKYGDTVENNRVLSAIYLSLGQNEKSRICRERAEALEKERAVKKESK